LREKTNVNLDLAPLQGSSTIFSQNMFVITICNSLQVLRIIVIIIVIFDF